MAWVLRGRAADSTFFDNAKALYKAEAASRDELLEAGAILCDVLPKNRQILGPSHPLTLGILSDLERVSMMLEDRPRET